MGRAVLLPFLQGCLLATILLPMRRPEKVEGRHGALAWSACWGPLGFCMSCWDVILTCAFCCVSNFKRACTVLFHSLRRWDKRGAPPPGLVPRYSSTLSLRSCHLQQNVLPLHRGFPQGFQSSASCGQVSLTGAPVIVAPAQHLGTSSAPSCAPSRIQPLLSVLCPPPSQLCSSAASATGTFSAAAQSMVAGHTAVGQGHTQGNHRHHESPGARVPSIAFKAARCPRRLSVGGEASCHSLQAARGSPGLGASGHYGVSMMPPCDRS